MDSDRFNLSFGEAIQELNNGKRLSRLAWGDRHLFIWKASGKKLKDDSTEDKILKEIATEVEFLPCIRLKTSDNKVLSGWVASSTDIFATDWFVVI